jgi:hypothetical protein
MLAISFTSSCRLHGFPMVENESAETMKLANRIGREGFYGMRQYLRNRNIRWNIIK